MVVRVYSSDIGADRSQNAAPIGTMADRIDRSFVHPDQVDTYKMAEWSKGDQEACTAMDLDTLAETRTVQYTPHTESVEGKW